MSIVVIEAENPAVLAAIERWGELVGGPPPETVYQEHVIGAMSAGMS